MKKQYVLKGSYDFDFVAIAINSHSKAYSLCWFLNKELGLNFEKNTDHYITEDMFFSRYSAVVSEGESYQLLSNRSKKGYLLTSHKKIDYFLIVSKIKWQKKKKEFMQKLKNIRNILLVFELELNKVLQAKRLITND